MSILYFIEFLHFAQRMILILTAQTWAAATMSGVTNGPDGAVRSEQSPNKRVQGCFVKCCDDDSLERINPAAPSDHIEDIINQVAKF